MKRPAPSPSSLSTARRFRSQIEQAVADGVPLGDLTLHLTLGDTAHLTRDREVPVADISFADGAMSFLGVKVVKGDVVLSVLRRDAAESA